MHPFMLLIPFPVRSSVVKAVISTGARVGNLVGRFVGLSTLSVADAKTGASVGNLVGRIVGVSTLRVALPRSVWALPAVQVSSRRARVQNPGLFILGKQETRVRRAGDVNPPESSRFESDRSGVKCGVSARFYEFDSQEIFLGPKHEDPYPRVSTSFNVR
jgi:hypothetical protein